MKVALTILGKSFSHIYNDEDSHFREESFLDTLAMAIANEGVDTEVHYLSEHINRPLEATHKFGHTVCLYPYPNLGFPRRLVSNIKKRRPDIIHTHSYHNPFDILLQLHARKEKIPIIVHNHGCWLPYVLASKYPLDILRRLFWFRKMLKNYDKMIVQSTGERNNLVSFGIPNERITIIPMGIADSFFKEPVASPNPFSLIYAGRFSEHKDLNTLALAMRELPIELNVCGSGDKKLFAPMLDFPPTFHGSIQRDKLTNYFQNASMTIVPAITGDGPGLVALESMACGTPIIGADISGIPDLVRHKENGLLYESGNPESLRKQILYARDNPSKVETWRRSAPTFIEPYRWKNIAPKILRVYEEILKDDCRR